MQPDEPLIVMTHSMGGNILYDILTHYAPTLRVDAWISVATQVGQFEEMKILMASQLDVRGPRRIAGLKPRLGYWLSVYDPVDVLAFKSAPVFEDVDEDLVYLTGESAFKAHGSYFQRKSFHVRIRERLEQALP